MELFSRYIHFLAPIAAILITAPLFIRYILSKSDQKPKPKGSLIIAIVAATCLSFICINNFVSVLYEGLAQQTLLSVKSGSSLLGLICSLALIFALRQIISSELPKFRQEIKKYKKIAEVFKQSYQKTKAELELRGLEVNTLSNEIDSIYEHQHYRETLGSNNVELYRRIFDSSPLFYIALSEKNEIDDINSFACQTLKYNFGELVSLRFLDIVIPEDRHRVGLLIDSFKRDGDVDSEFETSFRDKNRNKRAVTVKMQNFRFAEKQTTYLYCLDISESKALSDTLVHQANHDELTKLLNRRALEKYFDSQAPALSIKQKLALIYFDIDQLKVVNDTCGHTAGDQLIKQLIAILKPVCERYRCKTFARIGGDEFAIVAPDFDEQQTSMFAEALRSAAEDLTFIWDSKSFRQSISVGVAISDYENVSLKDLLSAADAACYSAKEQGRNQVKIHTLAEYSVNIDHRQGMHWVARLDKAMKQGDFLLNFQPIIQVDRPSAPYIHYEVLVQYLDEKGNKVPPGNFLPSAERFGKSTEIDLWVITETFDFLRKNPTHLRDLSCCSINLTSHSIANHRSREAIISLVRSHNFPDGKICFEITETSAISNLAEAIEFIKKLRSLGCRFALDDFGTGFSSFGYLKNLDVDYLKIDGAFIKDLKVDRLDKAMTKAICSIAKEMGIKTVAEYVENDQIMQELKLLGVDLGQGYGIAKPMPIEAIHEFYHDFRKLHG